MTRDTDIGALQGTFAVSADVFRDAESPRSNSRAAGRLCARLERRFQSIKLADRCVYGVVGGP